MPKLNLTGSVGIGGANNAGDVAALSARLQQLGFHWADLNTTASGELVRAIRLFQAIKNGLAKVDLIQNDGRVDAGGDTHKWLQAQNAPRWQNIGPSDVDRGWEKLIDTDEEDYGTAWLQETFAMASTIYRLQYLAAHANAALIVVNDCSLPTGRPVTDHAGHETGLMADLRLPRRDGTSGGITWQDATFDRDASRAIIVALRAAEAIDKVFFNDSTLISEGLCAALAGHDNHIHIQIVVPDRIA